MATLKITGVDEMTAQFVDDRTKTLHFKGKAEYLRSLIRDDMAKVSAERGAQLAAILSPLHEHSTLEGYSDEYLAEVFDRARNEVVTLRKRPKRSQNNKILSWNLRHNYRHHVLFLTATYSSRLSEKVATTLMDA